MRLLHFIVALAVLMSVHSTASASRGFAIKAMAHANAALMASPALPPLKAKKSTYDFSLRPALFSAQSDTDNDGDSNYDRSLDYKGQGLSLLVHGQLSDSLGWFIAGMGNQINGDFSTEGVHEGTPFKVNSNDVSSSMFQIGGGFSLTLLKDTFLPIQLFAGPSLTKTHVEQTVTSNQNDDFDMTMDPSTLGYMAGLQTGIYFGQWLAINPYVMVGGMINSNDRCQKYEANVRSYGPFWDFGEPECQDGLNSSTSKLNYDTSFSSVGLNLMIPKWGLSFNIMTETGKIPGYEEVDLELYYISLSL